MKKLILSIVVLSGIAFSACSKKEMPQNEKNIENENVDIGAISSISINIPGPIIIIKAKPFRQIARTKRGKYCGCASCFGICDIDLEGGLDFADGIIVPDLATNMARIYFLDSLANFENEFAIDQNLTVPPAALSGTSINSLNLLIGEYSFQLQTDTLINNSNTYISYGFVDIDISHN